MNHQKRWEALRTLWFVAPQHPWRASGQCRKRESSKCHNSPDVHFVAGVQGALAAQSVGQLGVQEGSVGPFGDYHLELRTQKSGHMLHCIDQEDRARMQSLQALIKTWCTVSSLLFSFVKRLQTNSPLTTGTPEVLLNNSRQIQHKLQEQDRHFSRQKHSLSAMSDTNLRERPSSMFRAKSSSLALLTISSVAPGGLQTEALCCQLQEAPWLLNPEHQLKSSGTPGGQSVAGA